MYIVRRSIVFIEGFLASYGPSRIKKRLWDRDFSRKKWDFIDNTVGDCVYPHLEKYARGGDILDLGCGPGNTANELAAEVYRSYIGVDISEVAIAKAEKRTLENGRADKNSFVQSDFLAFKPDKEFDIILFRESMYHVPHGKVLELLHKFSGYLKPDGVFIVRLYLGDHRTGKLKLRMNRKVNLIKSNFEIVESAQYNSASTPIVLVFRLRQKN